MNLIIYKIDLILIIVIDLIALIGYIRGAVPAGDVLIVLILSVMAQINNIKRGGRYGKK